MANAAQLPREYFGMREVMGEPNHSIMSSVYSSHVQADSKRLYQDLWKSWTGMNYLHSEMYVLNTTELGGWILNIFPVMKLQSAIEQFPNLRVMGDTMTYTSFEFHGSVLPEKSYQEWGHLQTSQRHSTDTGFTHHGCGFAVPMDWMDQPTTRHFFGCSIKQMSASTHTTWNSSILAKLEETCLVEYHRNLMNTLPMLPSEFKRSLDQVCDSCMALQKTGSGLQGIESKAMHVMRSRGVVPDMIITTATSIRYANAVREQTRMATDNGALIHPNQGANHFKSTDSEGTCRSPLFSIPMYEIPSFRLGATNTLFEPGQTILTVSQRFLMLPSIFHDNDFANYTTNCRSTEIVDGDSGCFSVVTLSDAYRASGLCLKGLNGKREHKKRLRNAQIVKNRQKFQPSENAEDERTELLHALLESQPIPGDVSQFNAFTLFDGADILDQVCDFLAEHPERYRQLELLAAHDDETKHYLNDLKRATGKNVQTDADKIIDLQLAAEDGSLNGKNPSAEAQREIPRHLNGPDMDLLQRAFGVCNTDDFNNLGGDTFLLLTTADTQLRLVYTAISQKLADVEIGYAVDPDHKIEIMKKILGAVGPLPSLPGRLNRTMVSKYFGGYEVPDGQEVDAFTPAQTVRHVSCGVELVTEFIGSCIQAARALVDANDRVELAALGTQIDVLLATHARETIKLRKSQDSAPTSELIKGVLQMIPVNDAFFEALLRHNIPFPVGFILFRLNVRLRVGCCIFLKSGKETGVVTIKDGRIMYQRDCDRFLVYVGSRFTTGICIFKPSNIELVPRTFATDYVGGAGVRLFDFTSGTHRDQVQNCNIDIADIFVVAVPYYWTPGRSDTDFTGKVDPHLVTVEDVDELHYPTATFYSHHWGKSEHHERAHIMWLTTDADAPEVQGRYTHAIQGLQKICKAPGPGGSVKFEEVVPGKDALGAFSAPADFAVFNNTADYLGRGVEGSHTRGRYAAQ
jgi:hypothetical protein